MKFTFAELRHEAEREYRMRQRVYPGRISTGRLSEGAAERQLAMQQAIIELLMDLEKTERLV